MGVATLFLRAMHALATPPFEKPSASGASSHHNYVYNELSLKERGMCDSKTEEKIEVLSRQVTCQVPEHWGKLPLTRFFDLATDNTYAVFAAHPEWLFALETLDDFLTERAPTIFHEPSADLRVSCQLYMRTFAIFRAACRLALAGQLFETTILARSIIECAVYAWACGQLEVHRTAWEQRADGPDQMKLAKEAFKWFRLMANLQEANVNPTLIQIIQE
ncbi:hypothetical protein [Variovorax sp. PvP013]|uniref:hypothetical protein n=1 Tax=Variovorax sp. PvP013 TaxID=3156435 RepID=UPI003D1B10FB